MAPLHNTPRSSPRKNVTDGSDIQFGSFDGFAWIRSTGKGNFTTSPAVKQCADHLIAQGARCIVVDLGACTGMDSTFMGMLTGLSLRLTKQDGGGRLEIACANEKNTASLEDLGLDALMEINPSGALWQQQLSHIHGLLQAWHGPGKITPRERSEQVLEAHQLLSATNPENAKKFETVVDLLEAELRKTNPTTPS